MSTDHSLGSVTAAIPDATEAEPPAQPLPVDALTIDHLATTLGIMLSAAHRFHFVLAAHIDLSARDAAVLAYLIRARGNQATPGEIGAHLALKSGTVTAILTRLEHEGLVIRTPHPDDRRSTLVRIQPALERRTAPVSAQLRVMATALAATADLPQLTANLQQLTHELSAVADAVSRSSHGD